MLIEIAEDIKNNEVIEGTGFSFQFIQSLVALIFQQEKWKKLLSEVEIIVSKSTIQIILKNLEYEYI